MDELTMTPRSSGVHPARVHPAMRHEVSRQPVLGEWPPPRSLFGRRSGHLAVRPEHPGRRTRFRPSPEPGTNWRAPEAPSHCIDEWDGTRGTSEFLGRGDTGPHPSAVAPESSGLLRGSSVATPDPDAIEPE